jgi:hypothetical protein
MYASGSTVGDAAAEKFALLTLERNGFAVLTLETLASIK